jgi:hypothetical protein
VVDPNNQPTPQDDDLPAGVAFPINEGFAQQWITGPDGAQPKGGQKEAAVGPPHSRVLNMWGRMDALHGRQPYHRDEYAWGPRAHGQYLRGWNETRAGVDAIRGTPAMDRETYAARTGRPDLHAHYLNHYAEIANTPAGVGSGPGPDAARSPQFVARRAEAGDSGSGVHPSNNRCTMCGHLPGCDCPHHCDNDTQEHHASRRVQADAWSQPRQTTDDQNPPYNSAETTPQPVSQNASPQAADYAAGLAAGKADKAAGQRPAFADNSSGVSPYVKGYATGYGAPGAPQGAQDVPFSMGGDSGQGQLVPEAQEAFQRSKASRVSASFVPRELLTDRDFTRGYRFAARWRPGAPLVKQGPAAFEAGLYAGITDRPEVHTAWLAEHALHAERLPELARRVALHRSFTVKTARKEGLRPQGAYLVAKDDSVPTPRQMQDAEHHLRDHERLSEISPARARQIVREHQQQCGGGSKTAGVSTDLITDGPGTSPDPMGSTPLNGPGTPPPMGGLDEANAPGGPAPYQGAPPLPGGPVVPDDVVGKPQRPPQPSGPFTNTFSGDHPENATLAPVAPSTAGQPGYSNPAAYQGNPGGGDRVARRQAFRERVQASLATMRETEGARQ